MPWVSKGVAQKGILEKIFEAPLKTAAEVSGKDFILLGSIILDGKI